VEVVVQDNGPGIPQEIAGRIFEPFFTTKKRGEGTGLGLGIARQIVDKHGGRIDVSSRPGCTRFVVRLPLAGPAVTPRHAVEVPADA
jgi:signal transduction histidine kinase